MTDPQVTGGGAAPRVPFVDLRRRIDADRGALDAAFDRVLRSGWLLDGPEVETFESEFAAYTGHKHAVAVASGTAALHLALVSGGVEPGSEVLVPAFTAVPTAAAVRAAGAVPVFVDVDRETALLDVKACQAATTSRTSAVVPVHLYGRPCPLPDLGVPVIEDAAQAHGALEAGGSAAVAYSFYPTKNLGGLTDGGAVVTNDGALARRVRSLRSHGRGHGYLHTVVASNSRMSDLAAAALRVGLCRLDEHNERRRAIAARYRAAAPHLAWQAPHERHVYHLCVARLPDREQAVRRLPFDTAVHYPLALTQQPAYAEFVREPCPEAEAWAAECVSMPCFPELTDNEIDLVCKGLS